MFVQAVTHRVHRCQKVTFSNPSRAKFKTSPKVWWKPEQPPKKKRACAKPVNRFGLPSACASVSKRKRCKTHCSWFQTANRTCTFTKAKPSRCLFPPAPCHHLSTHSSR